PVPLGEGARGGLTRGEHQACDHDLGLQEKYIPCGIGAEDHGQLRMTLGSSYKTRAFIVDTLEAWWSALAATEPVPRTRLQIKMANGPERSGRRTQCLHRMGGFAMPWASRFTWCITPPTIASISPSSAAGASWNCTGTGPSWWMWRRGW